MNHSGFTEVEMIGHPANVKALKLVFKCLLFAFCRSFESSDSPVIFAHQSKWQQHILATYGTDMCLIDATYKTTVYDLPLFFLCVFTNVGYVNVASFLLCDERHQSIEAGLRQIADWNSQWKPTQFISDFHEGQIGALETVFPGMLHATVIPSLIK